MALRGKGTGDGPAGSRTSCPLDPARLLRIANRLGEVERGSPRADAAIRQAPFGLVGSMLAFTTDDATARSLLPAGFEWLPPVLMASATYAACRRIGLDGNMSNSLGA